MEVKRIHILRIVGVTRFRINWVCIIVITSPTSRVIPGVETIDQASASYLSFPVLPLQSAEAAASDIFNSKDEVSCQLPANTTSLSQVIHDASRSS